MITGVLMFDVEINVESEEALLAISKDIVTEASKVAGVTKVEHVDSDVDVETSEETEDIESSDKTDPS